MPHLSVQERVKLFFASYPETSYKKGYVLVKRSNHVPTQIFFLEKGHVAQIKKINPGNEIILNIFKPGSFFPLVFALSGTQNQYDFATMSQVVVRTAPIQDVINFIESNPEVLKDILERMSKGVVGLLRHLEVLISSEAQIQIITILSTYAKRFGKREGGFYTVGLSLTHKTIASNLGLTRETVTRELKKLIAKGIVEKKGKCYLISVDKISLPTDMLASNSHGSYSFTTMESTK